MWDWVTQEAFEYNKLFYIWLMFQQYLEIKEKRGCTNKHEMSYECTSLRLKKNLENEADSSTQQKKFSKKVRKYYCTTTLWFE